MVTCRIFFTVEHYQLTDENVWMRYKYIVMIINWAVEHGEKKLWMLISLVKKGSSILINNKEDAIDWVESWDNCNFVVQSKWMFGRNCDCVITGL